MTAKIQTCSEEDTSACRLTKGMLYQLQLLKIQIGMIHLRILFNLNFKFLINLFEFVS